MLRLHATGPEFDDWLSNHAPMAVEALVRHGQAERIDRWIDAYEERLEPQPRGSDRITEANWREALGDPRRLGDWPGWFENELAEAAWTEVLAQWWPRLLPGLVASATHGVIRVGHAVRALREDGPSEARLAELAHAFGYWAARWAPLPGAVAPAEQAKVAFLDPAARPDDGVSTALSAAAPPDGGATPNPGGSGVAARPGAVTPAEQSAAASLAGRTVPTSGDLDAAAALAAVPRIPRQDGGIRNRLAQLVDLAGWDTAQRSLRSAANADAVPEALRGMVTAAVDRYLSHGHGNGIMLVHGATAPNAVLRVLPSLPREQWTDSAAFAWSATAAVWSIYGPAEPEPAARLPHAPEGDDATDEIFAVAAANGDAHVIKFADTALDVHGWTGQTSALDAAVNAERLIGS